MGGKGDDKNESLDPYSGKVYSADEMPKDASIPMEYNPLWQSDQNPLLSYSAGAPLLLAPNTSREPVTPFDSYRLNQLVDLVEPSVPQDLEDVGEALWDAARAIKTAETELKTHFDEAEADWEGETKKAFHDWGKDLRKNTLKLSEYAATVGSHLKGAGIGLAMVKTSMPKRDPGDDKAAQKGGKGLPPHVAPEIADQSTPEGRKREKHRQEAITQMTRLSSYYQVALQHIQTAEKDKPAFGAMPDVGMPPAPPAYEAPAGGQEGGSASAPAVPHSGGSAFSNETGHTASPYVPRDDRAISRDEPTPHYIPDGPVRPGTSVATDLDSGPPAPVVQPVDPGSPPQLPPAPSQPGPPSSGPPNPGPFVPPGGQPPGRVGPPPPGRVGPGTSGPPRPYVPQPVNMGRTGPTGPNGPVGRPGAPRPGPVGPVAPGTAGRQTGSNNGIRGLGRPGMMGVPPTTTGSSAGGRGTNSGSARALKRGGIVGGTPSGSGSGSNSPGSRASRGTVIDGQGTTAARRPTGMVPPVSGGGSGGTTGNGGGARSSNRKATTNRDGIVGEPRNGDVEQESDSRGSIPGGGGLIVGGQLPSPRRKKREDKRRPDYLTEGQNGPSERRGSVPPVIE